MVHTIRTRAISRGRGRGRGGRRTPYGLGPNGGSIDSHHSSARHVSGRQTRSGSPVPTGEASSRASARRDTSSEPSEDYTPRTPTREDMEETIETLRGENTELRERLAQSLGENARLRGWLDNLQRAHVDQGEALNKLVAENADLIEERHALHWDKVVLEQERRIAARTWGTRIRDRTRFYKGATTEYVGKVKGYFSDWVKCYKKGPKTSVLWRFKPSSSFEEWVRDPYLPYYPSDKF